MKFLLFTVLSSVASSNLIDLHTLTYNFETCTIDLEGYNYSNADSTLFEDYPNAKVLNIRSCALLTFPRCDKILPDLVEINYTFNPMTKDFSNLKHLKNIVKLNISDCHTGFPIELCSLTNLVSLNLSNNNIVEIPREIGDLTKLQALSITGNSFLELPASIGMLQGLKTLDLSSNGLFRLHTNMYMLQNLVELNLSDNNLNVLPPAICVLSKLKSLSYTNNQITSVLISEPDAITFIHNIGFEEESITCSPSLCCYPLKKIFSRDNFMAMFAKKLKTLENGICNLHNLINLDLSDNEIEEFPIQMKLLKQIVDINMTRNKLSAMPNNLKFNKLKHLDISNNDFSVEPTMFLKRNKGTNVLLENNPFNN